MERIFDETHGIGKKMNRTKDVETSTKTDTLGKKSRDKDNGTGNLDIESESGIMTLK